MMARLCLSRFFWVHLAAVVRPFFLHFRRRPPATTLARLGSVCAFVVRFCG